MLDDILEVRFENPVRIDELGNSISSTHKRANIDVVERADGGVDLRLADGSVVSVRAHNVRYVWRRPRVFAAEEPKAPVTVQKRRQSKSKKA